MPESITQVFLLAAGMPSWCYALASWHCCELRCLYSHSTWYGRPGMSLWKCLMYCAQQAGENNLALPFSRLRWCAGKEKRNDGWRSDFVSQEFLAWSFPGRGTVLSIWTIRAILYSYDPEDFLRPGIACVSRGTGQAGKRSGVEFHCLLWTSDILNIHRLLPILHIAWKPK